MKRMAIVGSMVLGLGTLVALGAAQCVHADAGIWYRTDSLGRQVPAQTLSSWKERTGVTHTSSAGEAQVEPSMRNATMRFRIDGLGRKVPNQTTSPWVERARRALSTVPSMIRSEAEAKPAGIRYYTDSLGRKVPSQTIAPLG